MKTYTHTDQMPDWAQDTLYRLIDAGIVKVDDKGEIAVQEMVAEYERRRDYAVDAINAIDGLSCKKPDGAFYIFVNVRSLGMTSAEAANYFLEEAHIATVPGSAFGPQGEGFIRISYACSYERIVEGMERLKKAVEKRQASR